MTECRASTDVSRSERSGLKTFVEDETVNEFGGESMEKSFEDAYEKDGDGFDSSIANCSPVFDGEPTFRNIDTNHDNFISKAEFEDMSHKMCIPDEMSLQLWNEADANGDGVITNIEFENVGEDTQAEEGIDKIVDPDTEGDDEYNEVKMPAFDTFDQNSDGKIDMKEFVDLLTLEHHRRYPTLSDKEVEQWVEKKYEELLRLFKKVDVNRDQGLSQQEYYTEDKDDDMGEEMEEAQDGKRASSPDPDDLRRVEHPMAVVPAAASSAAPTLIRADVPRRFHLQQDASAARKMCAAACSRYHLLSGEMRGLRKSFRLWLKHKATRKAGRTAGSKLLAQAPSRAPTVPEMRRLFGDIVDEVALVAAGVGAHSAEGQVVMRSVRTAREGVNRYLDRLQQRDSRLPAEQVVRQNGGAMQRLTAIVKGLYGSANELDNSYKKQLQQDRCQCRTAFQSRLRHR